MTEENPSDHLFFSTSETISERLAREKIREKEFISGSRLPRRGKQEESVVVNQALACTSCTTSSVDESKRERERKGKVSWSQYVDCKRGLRPLPKETKDKETRSQTKRLKRVNMTRIQLRSKFHRIPPGRRQSGRDASTSGQGTTTAPSASSSRW